MAFKKFINEFRRLPERKVYIEAITAFLSLPIMVTVLLLNLNNLRKTQSPAVSATTTPSVVPAVTTVVLNSNQLPNQGTNAGLKPTLTPDPVGCKKEIGPVAISSPLEGEVVVKNPVNIDITGNREGYCAIVWSYSINSGDWTDYTDKSISVYDLPAGNKQVSVKVKSVVTGEEKIFTRNFVYMKETTPTPNPTNIPSLTPTLILTPTTVGQTKTN